MIRSVHNDRGTGQPRTSLGLIHLKDSISISGRIAFTMANVGDGLLTVGGVLTVLNIKTTSKCSIAGVFLIKGITQHYPRY